MDEVVKLQLIGLTVVGLGIVILLFIRAQFARVVGFVGKGQCALCHSIGPSESARCPDLKGIGAKLSREFIFESLTQPQAYIYLDYRHEGPPKEYPARMPYINKNPIGLTKNEILSVIAFLQQMSGEPISVSPSELEVPGQAPSAPVKAGDSGPVAVAQAR
jgi:Cytochrome c